MILGNIYWNIREYNIKRPFFYLSSCQSTYNNTYIIYISIILFWRYLSTFVYLSTNLSVVGRFGAGLVCKNLTPIYLFQENKVEICNTCLTMHNTFYPFIRYLIGLWTKQVNKKKSGKVCHRDVTHPRLFSRLWLKISSSLCIFVKPYLTFLRFSIRPLICLLSNVQRCTF